jgi:hypothetical protein
MLKRSSLLFKYEMMHSSDILDTATVLIKTSLIMTLVVTLKNVTLPIRDFTCN